MSKIRIYELAKELGTDNKTLENLVRGLGIEIKTVSSTLSAEDETIVRRKFSDSASSGSKPSEPPSSGSSTQQVIRRRAAQTRHEGEAAPAVRSTGPGSAQAVTPASAHIAPSAPNHRPVVRMGEPVRPTPAPADGYSGRSVTSAPSAPRPHAVPSAAATPPQARSVSESQEQGAAVSQDSTTLRTRDIVERTPSLPHAVQSPSGVPVVAEEPSAFEMAAQGTAASKAVGAVEAQPIEKVTPIAETIEETRSAPASSASIATRPVLGDLPRVESEPKPALTPDEVVSVVSVTEPTSAPTLKPNAAADSAASGPSTPGHTNQVAERSTAQQAARPKNQPTREPNPSRPVNPTSPVRPQKSNPPNAGARSSGAPSTPSPASKPEIRRPAVEVGQRIELPKGTRRLPGGMAERLDQEQDQPLRRRPDEQRHHSAAQAGAEVSRRHVVGDRPGRAPQEGAGSPQGEPARSVGGAPSGGVSGQARRPDGSPVNRPGVPDRSAHPGARVDRPGEVRLDARSGGVRHGERSTEGHGDSSARGEDGANAPMHDDRDGSIVRDASGVIVGAGRKKSEPKIVGFINIEPRKRPQQVIITEVSSPSKQGRASARKQREEKVQQQGRRRTLATRGAPRREIPSGRGRLRGTAAEMSEAKKRVRVDEAIELSDLAHQMGVKASRILRTLWQMGTRGVTINSSIDVEMAELVAAEFGYTVENVSFDEEDLVDLPEQGEGTLRAPVVTVMGHVDHGKTTLLDRIREANVAGGEAGGITQHVGAYRVDTNAGPIVFLDTPGHQAFIAMRERGAMLTDILVLVVAADDGVMPTTVEAIKLAKAENLPIVVALNKIDKPEANPARVKRELMNEGVVSEEFGGEVPIVEISAKTGLNLEKLLELLALQAEVLDLRASDEGRAVGTVIEARIEKGRGVIATVLIEHGTLRRGDVMVAGEQSGKVRAMLTDRGDAVDEVGPSTPVEIFGLDGVPGGGEKFAVVESEKDARQLVAHRREIRRRKESAKSGISALERMKRKKDHCLKIVLRADVAGSVEAVKNSIEELSNSRVRAEVISSGVGTINETDIKLAHAGEAIVIGFNTKPAGQTARLAESLDVQIHTFAIIYEAVDRVRELMLDLLPPEYREKPLGTAEVRALFPIPRLGMVCGCRVTRGLVNRSAHVRVRRGDKMIHEGRLSSLRVFKEDVKEVKEGFECGIVVEGFEGAQAGDVIEAFELEVIRPTM